MPIPNYWQMFANEMKHANGESHTHWMNVDGRYFNASVEPVVYMKPKEGSKRPDVQVICPYCDERLPNTEHSVLHRMEDVTHPIDDPELHTKELLPSTENLMDDMDVSDRQQTIEEVHQLAQDAKPSEPKATLLDRLDEIRQSCDEFIV